MSNHNIIMFWSRNKKIIFCYALLTKDLIVSESSITPCIKIDKPLVVYIKVMICHGAHNNIAHRQADDSHEMSIFIFPEN